MSRLAIQATPARVMSRLAMQATPARVMSRLAMQATPARVTPRPGNRIFVSCAETTVSENKLCQQCEKRLAKGSAR
jgi:hypothetical protein